MPAGISLAPDKLSLVPPGDVLFTVYATAISARSVRSLRTRAPISMLSKRQVKTNASKPARSRGFSSKGRKRNLPSSPGGSDFNPEPMEWKVRKPLTKADKERFKRFRKRAREAGLLVTRASYELYFRNHHLAE